MVRWMPNIARIIGRWWLRWFMSGQPTHPNVPLRNKALVAMNNGSYLFTPVFVWCVFFFKFGEVKKKHVFVVNHPWKRAGSKETMTAWKWKKHAPTQRLRPGWYGLCIPFEKKQTTQQYMCMVCIGWPKISFLKFQTLEFQTQISCGFGITNRFGVKGSTHQLTISQMPCLGFHSAEVNSTTTTGRTTLPRLPWDIRGRTSWEPRGKK